MSRRIFSIFLFVVVLVGSVFVPPHAASAVVDPRDIDPAAACKSEAFKKGLPISIGGALRNIFKDDGEGEEEQAQDEDEDDGEGEEEQAQDEDEKDEGGGGFWNKLKNIGKGALSGTGLDLAASSIPGGSFIKGVFDGATQGEQQVSDSETRRSTERIAVGNCIRFLKNNALRIAIESFGKKSLDLLVDDVVSWIQNGGDPRFIQDFGDFFDQAKDEAIGEAIVDLGGADFCTPYQSQQLQLQLISDSPPKLSRRVSCTLSDVTDNVEAFYNDFTQGGWIGYAGLLEPQNNQYGQTIIILDELLRREEEAREAAQTEAIASRGYTSQRQCVEWQVYDEDNVPHSNPYNDPEVVAGFIDQGLEVICLRNAIVTPGDTIAEAAAKAHTIDFDYITQDLNSYVSQVLDAGIRRLIDSKEEGLAGAELSRSSRGEEPQTVDERIAEIGDPDDPSLDPASRQRIAALQSYDSSSVEFGKTASEVFASSTASLLRTSTKKEAEDLLVRLDELELLMASTSALMPRYIALKDDATDLLECQRDVFKNPNDPDGAPSCQTSINVIQGKIIPGILKFEKNPPSFAKDLQGVNALRESTQDVLDKLNNNAEADSVSLSFSLGEIEYDVERIFDLNALINNQIQAAIDQIGPELLACKEKQADPQNVTYICPSLR